MKINARILLINFLVVSIIIGGSAVSFYSIVEELLTSQESKKLLNSTNDFLNLLESQFREMDQFIGEKLSQDSAFTFQKFEVRNDSPVDFVFSIANDSLIFPNNVAANSFIQKPTGIFSIKEFASINPYLLIRNIKTENNKLLYYGINFSGRRLDVLSRQIKSEIAVFFNTDIVVYSHEQTNEKYIGYINNAFERLYKKNNFEIHFEDSDEIAFYASIYQIREFTYKETAFNVLFFSTIEEFSLFRKALQKILTVLGLAGLALGIVLTFLFTTKLRNQITELYRATTNLKEGDYQKRISIVSKDEIGSLAESFNNMLDELQKREQLAIQYTEFLTLINNHPALNELSEAAVKKIIMLGDFSGGALSLISDEHLIEGIYSFGNVATNKNETVNNLYFSAIAKNQIIELDLNKDTHAVKNELTSRKINYLIIMPVVYNQKIIAILEFSAIKKPSADINEYIRKVVEQLAIGLANSITLNRLEKLIEQLKELNASYQKQNLEIIEKNDRLMALSGALRKQTEELERQKTIAETAAKTKTRFLTTMSHELRTPMNSIIGLTDIVVNDSNLDAKNKERISVVNKSSKRLMNLINDVLDVSKIEAGKLNVKYQSFSLINFLNDIKSSLNPLAQEKQIELIFEMNFEKNIIIKTDQIKLGQILTNIIGNGIKFTSKGFVKLNCWIKNYSLKLLIADTGIGINKNDLRSIFEEYEQAESSIIPKYTGTGLGLSIAKNFTELLGGTISVQSELNKGTIFTLQIPTEIFIQTELEHDEEAESKKFLLETNEEKFSASDNLHFPSILITEDDPSSLFTICEIVKEIDCKIFTAKNGIECLAALNKENIDIVLLDIMMPEMDGFQALNEIRKNDSWKELPVFAVTAKAMQDDYDTIFKHGFNGIFPKPVDREELLYKLNNELNKLKAKSNV